MNTPNIPEIRLVPLPNAKSPRRGLWFIPIFGLILGGVLFINLWTYDRPNEPPRLLGSVWTAKVTGQPRLYYVMEEERYQRRVPSYAQRQNWFTVSYALFTLHARDAHNGTRANTTELARIDNAVSGQGPEILGPQGNVLWLWNGNLEGRKLDTLESLWTATKLTELNPDLAAVLPTDRQYYKVLGKLNALVFKGKDARYFQIDSATGKIQPLDDVTLGRHFHTKKADDTFTYLFPESDSLWSTSISGLMWNSLTVGDTWYALLSADERANLVDSPGNGNAPWGESARSLYRVTFQWEYRKLLGTNEIKLNPAAVTAVNAERFLMGGFLRRPNTEGLWTVDGGKSYLVLHRRELGDSSPWYVTRLGLDGTIHWTHCTGLADPQHLCDGQGTVIFTGFAASSQPTRKRPDLFVFIDELSGQTRMLNLVNNEITTAQFP